MFGLSPRRSGIRVGCCISWSRSWKITKLKASSPGWSVKERRAKAGDKNRNLQGWRSPP
ncbi:hypothetical protein E2C01_045290 [Portunus trituberculatus]|uniref:Uncharacterized protein n=1 Tax=Portunus trituberculatus TaxID=210409 RepID=A0A5B7G4M7_PORTR|nr:hypothetical protein [Portunus trituberculatus]